MLTFLSPLFDRFQTAIQAAMSAIGRHFVMKVAGRLNPLVISKRKHAHPRNIMTSARSADTGAPAAVAPYGLLREAAVAG
jgi:hypothetical protein